MINGDLAERYGYVNRSLPDSELDAFVDALATRIASFEREVITEIKRLVDIASLPPDSDMKPEWDAFMKTSASPTAQARINFLLDKGFSKARRLGGTPELLHSDLFEISPHGKANSRWRGRHVISSMRQTMNHPRKPEYSVEPVILNRWSPRSFIPAEMPKQDLMSLFEAARWAPSSFNNQPWRFLYAGRESIHWRLFLDLLAPGNRSWAQDASVLVVVLSNTRFDHNGSPSVTHSFDAGAAWENLALQASAKGYAAHGMEGFDHDKARADLGGPGRLSDRGDDCPR